MKCFQTPKALLQVPLAEKNKPSRKWHQGKCKCCLAITGSDAELNDKRSRHQMLHMRIFKKQNDPMCRRFNLHEPRFCQQPIEQAVQPQSLGPAAHTCLRALASPWLGS